MPDIITLGELLWEMSAVASEPGHYTLGFAGDALGFAVTAVRQGASVGLVTRVGNDPFGAQLRVLLEHEGVDCAGMVVDERAVTGGRFLHQGPAGGQRSEVRAGTAASSLAPGDIDGDAVADAVFVYASSLTQALSASASAAVLALLREARAQGVSTAFRVRLQPRLWTRSEAREAIAATLALTDYAFLGYDDARNLCGSDDVAVIMKWAHGLGAQVVLLTRGADGVCISQGAGADVIAMASFEVDRVAEGAIGAGDCFAGATVARLVAGDALLDAVRHANAAASLAVRASGLAAIPDRERVRQFLASQV